jgi:hypothetical protein
MGTIDRDRLAKEFNEFANEYEDDMEALAECIIGETESREYSMTDLGIVTGILVFEYRQRQRREKEADPRYMECEGGCKQLLPKEELNEDNVCESCQQKD